MRDGLEGPLGSAVLIGLSRGDNAYENDLETVPLCASGEGYGHTSQRAPRLPGSPLLESRASSH